MAPRGMRDSDDCYQATSRGPITYCSDAGQPSLYGSEAPTPTKRQKGPWSWPALATCRLRQGHWHKHRVWVPLLVILPLLVIYTLSRALMHWNSRGWSEAACNPAGRPPVISDIYVIHSYWSAERRDNAPNICKRIAEQTDTYLSRVPCMTFPGYHATTATDAEVGCLRLRRSTRSSYLLRPPLVPAVQYAQLFPSPASLHATGTLVTSSLVRRPGMLSAAHPCSTRCMPALSTCIPAPPLGHRWAIYCLAA